MIRLAIAYTASGSSRERDAPTLAPPPYTVTDLSKSSESELPLYSIADPYFHLQSAPLPTSEGQGSPTHYEDTSTPATLEVAEADNVPLLPDDEQQ